MRAGDCVGCVAVVPVGTWYGRLPIRVGNSSSRVRGKVNDQGLCSVLFGY